MIDFLDELEILNKEINIKWKSYIESKQDELSILDKIKDMLGIVKIREDISYDSKRKDNILESKKLYPVEEVLNDKPINNLSDLEFKYSEEQFISEYVIENNEHIITNCYFENEGQDLYITEYTLSKLTKDLDTTIELLQLYSILDGLLYFYTNIDEDLFVIPIEDETKDILLNKEITTFETKLEFANKFYNLISQ